MSKKKIDTVKRSITTTKGLEGMMVDLLETGRFISYDDIIRKGIAMVYDSINPPYKKPTINQEVKIEKRSKEILIKNMPDEEFVAQTLEDVMIYTDTEDKKWVLTRGRSNSICGFPLEGIKDWVANPDNPWYEVHLQAANTGQQPYEWFLQYNEPRKYLAQRFGIAIKYDPKVNGGIYDEELGAVRP